MNMTVKLSPDGWRPEEYEADNIERIIDDRLVRFSFKREYGQDFPLFGNGSRVLWADVDGDKQGRYIVCEYRKVPAWQHYVIELLTEKT